MCEHGTAVRAEAPINARGRWSASPKPPRAGRAFLYSNVKMVNLNALDTSSPLVQYLTQVMASGINDSGWIVANGSDSQSG